MLSDRTLILGTSSARLGIQPSGLDGVTLPPKSLLGCFFGIVSLMQSAILIACCDFLNLGCRQGHYWIIRVDVRTVSNLAKEAERRLQHSRESLRTELLDPLRT